MEGLRADHPAPVPDSETHSRASATTMAGGPVPTAPAISTTFPPADSVPLLTIPPKRTSRLGLDRYLCAYYSLLAAVTETRRLYP